MLCALIEDTQITSASWMFWASKSNGFSLLIFHQLLKILPHCNLLHIWILIFLGKFCVFPEFLVLTFFLAYVALSAYFTFSSLSVILIIQLRLFCLLRLPLLKISVLLHLCLVQAVVLGPSFPTLVGWSSMRTNIFLLLHLLQCFTGVNFKKHT